MPLRRYDRRIALLYLIVIPLALVAIAAFSYIDHRQSNARDDAQQREARQQRIDTRAAVVLIGHAICGQSAFFEAAALKNAKTAHERKTILDFFRDYNSPVDDALGILNAASCDKVTKPRPK